LTPGQTDPKGTQTRFWCIERKSTLLGVSCGCVEETKNAREGTTSPLCPPHPRCAAATIFCVWGRTVVIIKHANFQVNRFGVSEPQWAKMTLLPSTDLAHRP